MTDWPTIEKCKTERTICTVSKKGKRFLMIPCAGNGLAESSDKSNYAHS